MKYGIREMIMEGNPGASGGGSGTGSGGGAGAGASGASGGGSGTPPAGGSGTTGTGGAPAPAAGTTGTPPASAPADWTTGLNDDFKGYVQNKGWKDPASVLDSYRNLEKLVGAPQDKILKLPADDDAAGWESVFTRLGRPANAEGYKIDVPKEGGASPEFVKWASEQFFKAGLNPKQANAIIEGWNGLQKQSSEQANVAYQAKLKTEVDGLRKEWGAAHDTHMAQAQQAARAFGVKPEVVQAMERAVGYTETMKFFQSIGSKIGEANFVGGQAAGGNAPMTPAQARTAIKERQSDQGFVKRYLSRDVGAMKEMETLHKYAYPDEAQG